MALVGNGDPRWIVMNREDGTNVNGWHWAEKDATKTLAQALAARLNNTTLAACNTPADCAHADHEDDDTEHIGVIKALESEVKGEATANNRKGKTIFLYEVSIKIPFEGKILASSGEKVNVSGNFEFPYVGEDNEGDKYDITITINCSDAKVKQQVDTLLRTKARMEIQHRVEEALKEMKDKFKPTQPQPQTPPPAQTSVGVKVTSDKEREEKGKEKEKKAEHHDTGVVEIEKKFSTRATELYSLFLDKQRMSMLTGSEAKIDPKVGGKFELFNGSVSGEFTELVPDIVITQKWRFNSWEHERYSIVKITFEQKQDTTLLTVKQTGIPHSDVERAKAGWNENYFSRIPAIFGFSPIFQSTEKQQLLWD